MKKYRKKVVTVLEERDVSLPEILPNVKSVK